MIGVEFNKLVEKYGMRDALEMVLYHREGLSDQDKKIIKAVRGTAKAAIDKRIAAIEASLKTSKKKAKRL